MTTLKDLIEMRPKQDLLNMEVDFAFGHCSRNDPENKPESLVIEVHLKTCPRTGTSAKGIAPNQGRCSADGMSQPITLPDNTLRDHIDDLVMQVLAREKLKRALVRPDATLRDQFAIAALGGMMCHEVAADSQCIVPRTKNRASLIAESAYLCADAMLEARKLKAVAA